MSTGELKVFAQGERELVMTRRFAAPRRLVFEAHTRPELIRQWLLGPPGWTMPVCEVDLRVGGRFRYLWRHEKDGREMGMGGEYREIVVPERIVSTEVFDDPWYPGEAVGTVVLEENSGVTTLIQTMVYDTREIRDAILKSPMESGVAASYDRLETIMAGDAGAGA